MLMTMSGKEDLVGFWTSVGQKLGIAAYLTCDGAVALEYLGLLKLTKRNLRRAQKQASFFWAVSIASGMVACLYNLQKLQPRPRTEAEEKGVGSQIPISSV